MSDEPRDQLAVLALGALPPDEAAQAVAVADADPALAAELEGHRQTVAALEDGLAREAPPPGQVHRILAAIDLPAPAPRREERRSLLRFPRPALAAAFGVLAAALLAVVALVDSTPAPAAEAALAGPGVRGEALLYRPDAVDGYLVLRLDSIPAPPDGSHYEIWVLRAGAASKEAVGVFAHAGRIALTLTLPGGGRYREIDISVEENGGDPDHSGRTLVSATFDS